MHGDLWNGLEQISQWEVFYAKIHKPNIKKIIFDLEMP